MAFTPPDKESIHRARTFPMALALLRVAGHQTGYAIAVHGSQARDLDVVAVPWTEEAGSAEEFIEAVRAAFAHWGVTAIHADGDHPLPRMMPHGRLCWPFHFGGGPYLDLAVMSRRAPVPVEPEVRHSEGRVWTCSDCGKQWPNNGPAPQTEPVICHECGRKKARGNLSFEGNGRVSVDVNELVKSPRFQQQVAAVRELEQELSRHPQFRVPSGWKLVPIGLYGLMEIKAVDAAVNATPRPWAPAFWEAALAYAPEPPDVLLQTGRDTKEADHG